MIYHLPMTVSAARTEESNPTGLRVAMHPNGVTTIQGAFRWWQGSDGGITWRDLPVVQVDFDGKEIL